MLSVDGTDFLMAMSYKKAFYSFKFKKMGLGCDLLFLVEYDDNGVHLKFLGSHTPSYAFLFLGDI